MRVLILGGNRFFGKRLVANLLEKGVETTLLNRGHLDDGFGSQVSRIICDRKDHAFLRAQLKNKTWDLVYDQICYEGMDARNACEVFQGNVGHYIVTSSQSVYAAGANLSEDAFNPLSYHFNKDVSSSDDYAEGKRQVESIFAQQAKFPVCAVRFPIVLGEDDYTGRLKFHVDRIRKGLPIFFPNIEAKISFIHSVDAAYCLQEVGIKKVKGSINCCAKDPIKLREVINVIEDLTHKKANISDTESKESYSPFGIESDWYMNTEKMSSVGIKTEPIIQWLPGLVSSRANCLKLG